MAQCDVCGNPNSKTFRVLSGGRSHEFDCFECAIERLAPRCAHCRIHVVGHGEEVGGKFYCSTHCLKAMTEGPRLQPLYGRGSEAKGLGTSFASSD